MTTSPTIAAMAQHGISLGENPNMSSPRVRAAAARITESAEIAESVIAAGLTTLDLREFRDTPAGGYTDGVIIHVQTAAQVAADMIRWYRPDVAFRRAREILEMTPPPAPAQDTAPERNEFFYRDAFTSSTTWGPGVFEADCAAHGITPSDDEFFCHTAARLWDALNDAERAEFASDYDDWLDVDA